MQGPLFFLALISIIVMKGELIMTYKQIQAAHEIRMWIGQVIIPAIIGGVMLASNPYVRTWVGNKVYNIKLKINSKKNKSGN